MRNFGSSFPAVVGGESRHKTAIWIPRQWLRGMTTCVLCLHFAFPVFSADYGDAYVDSSIGDASTLNPLLASDSASSDICGLVFNGLVKYDKNIQLVGDLAESWNVSQGGLVITFHLRRGVRWHDGLPFTADDVLFTYEKLRDPKVHTPFASDFDDVASVTAPDPYTVRVVYRKQFAPGLASWGMGILPRHVYETGDLNTHPANRAPIGTGPYRFKEWKTDQYLLLEAYPDYFEGKPYIQRYVYRIIPDSSVQFLEMRNQSIDAITLTPDQYKAYDAIFEHHERYRYPSFKYTYLGFNLKNPLFKDLRVRQAMAYAIDRQTLVQGIVLGLGQPITGPFPVTSWAYNTQVKDLPYDPEKAKSLLAEAGWKPDASGKLMKDGKPLAFTLMTNQGNKVRELCSEVIQQQLKKIGIDVTIRIMEWSTFIHQYVDKKDFEAVVLGWQLGRDPDNYAMWHSSQQKEGEYNFCGYENPQVDRWLVEARETFDDKKREAFYHQIHAQIAADLPYIFLYCPDELVAIHKRFRGPEVAPLGIAWNFREWWVPKSEQRYKTEIAP
jgi:peptide/nickel transport system substrate-binding protein